VANAFKKLAVLSAAVFAVLCACGPPLTRGWVQGRAESPLSNWRPGRDPGGVGYVGTKTCAGCHTQEAATYAASPMANASAAAADCEILKKHTPLTFREGTYTYQITRRGAESVYTVSDGAGSISEPILYCFGQGVAGQTYIFRHGGALYESRVSFFRTLGGLGLTILHPREVPATLAEAVGRRMSPEGARGCFACHTTAAVAGPQLKLERLAAGVSCESCHGPGERHVAAARAKNFKELEIFNPGRLDALDLTQEFCGTCHVGFEEVLQMPEQGGAGNIRFQPYRLLKSRGHLSNDRRISCVACHDPHGELKREPDFYDSKCTACHLNGPGEVKTKERAAAACPVATRQCVTCHMPKVGLPEMHFKFTDHFIRTPRPNEPTPR
jgi:Cytochrome c3